MGPLESAAGAAVSLPSSETSRPPLVDDFGSPSELSLQRFQDALNGAGATAGGPGRPAGGRPGSIGSRILDSLDGVSKTMANAREVLERTMARPNLSMADVMEASYRMNVMSAEVELFSKAAGRTSQDLDQLLKMQ